MSIGQRIKELREELGLSQMALSNATGISQSAIARWEVCKTEPTASSLYILASFFNESSDYLIGLTD